MLDKFFQLSEHNTTIRTEAIGGITIFPTMACIGFVAMVALDRLAVPGALDVGLISVVFTFLFVACMVTRGLAELDWNDVAEYAPAVVTAIAKPLTFSIATGIGFGFISYTAIKILCGRFDELNPAIAVLAIAFIVKFGFP